MHVGSSGDDEPMSEMNMIPLIDVALTLLIIMMVTTAFVRKPGIALKLPETVTREGSKEMSKDQVVLIARDGGLFMDGKPMTDAEVQARMQAVGRANKEARVLIKGDRDVVYSRVMAVMDLARQAGLSKVVLPTDPKLGQLGQPSAPAPSGAAPADGTTPPVPPDNSATAPAGSPASTPGSAGP